MLRQRIGARQAGLSPGESAGIGKSMPAERDNAGASRNIVSRKCCGTHFERSFMLARRQLGGPLVDTCRALVVNAMPARCMRSILAASVVVLAILIPLFAPGIAQPLTEEPRAE